MDWPTCPLVLIGAPAAGKSSLGRWLASALQAPFFDLDQVIEKHVKQPIADYIHEQGLAAFRDLERDQLHALLEKRTSPESGGRCIIALGAGATVSEENRRRLQQHASCVLLTVSDTIALERAAHSTARPLLQGDRPALRYRMLEESRAPERHALAHLTVSTDGRSVEEVGREILEAVRDGVFRLPISGAELPAGLTIFNNEDELRHALPPAKKGQTLWVVDEKVAQLYPHWVSNPDVVVVDATGVKKRLPALEQVLDAAIALPRDGRLVAIGGGALLDVVGLAASLARRGIGWEAVPTTLLAMADAGLGGKTAIDHAQGRNLIGSFWPPQRLLIWPGWLKSLAPRERRSGAVEILKHLFLDREGMTGAPPSLLPPSTGTGLQDLLAAHSTPSALALLSHSLRFKSSLVDRDPKEQGLRRALNLGHTFGHAIESVAAGKLLHGEAVAHGLLIMLSLSERLAGLEREVATAARLLLKDFAPPLPNIEDKALRAALLLDKKASEQGLQWVLWAAPGRVKILPIEEAVVWEVWRAHRSAQPHVGSS